MRNRQLVVDESLVFALLLQDFALKLQNVDMVRHVIEVDSGRRAIVQKVYVLDSDLRIFMFLILLLLGADIRRIHTALGVLAWLLLLRAKSSLMLRVAIETVLLVFRRLVELLFDDFVEVEGVLLARLLN